MLLYDLAAMEDDFVRLIQIIRVSTFFSCQFKIAVCARHSGRNKQHHGGCYLYPPDPLFCGQGYRGNTILRELCALVHRSSWCGMKKNDCRQFCVYIYGIHLLLWCCRNSTHQDWLSTRVKLLCTEQNFRKEVKVPSERMMSAWQLWLRWVDFPQDVTQRGTSSIISLHRAIWSRLLWAAC